MRGVVTTAAAVDVATATATATNTTGCVYLYRPHANDTSPYDSSVCEDGALSLNNRGKSVGFAGWHNTHASVCAPQHTASYSRLEGKQAMM